MHDVSYERFRLFFSYLKGKGVISLEEYTDLMTEYLQNGYVTFNNLSSNKSKEAKELFKQYANGSLKIE